MEKKSNRFLLLTFVFGVIGLVTAISTMFFSKAIKTIVIILSVLFFVLAIGSFVYSMKIESDIANKKKKEEEERKEKEQEKRLKEHSKIIKENNLEEVQFNKEFKREFGISFLEFKKSKKPKSILLYNEETSKFYIFEKIVLMTKEYFLLYDKSSITPDFAKLTESVFWNNSMLDIYKRISIKDVKKVLYPYDNLEYVEFIEDVEEKTGSTVTQYQLEKHEFFHGTASAMKKAQDSTFTYKNDRSKVLFYFSSNMHIGPLENNVGKQPNQFPSELLTIWNDKNINRVQTKALINNKENQKDKSLQKIRELKQLLDEGIITQEEFDIKKKELLGL